MRVHSSVWIEWLPAEQLVEGSNPSGPDCLHINFVQSRQKINSVI